MKNPPEDVNTADRQEVFADTFRNAWSETIGDAERMAEGRSAEGWETLVIPAGDTAPEPPQDGPEGRFGLVHVIPGNRAEQLSKMLEDASFPSFEVYRATVNGQVFFVTELIDEEQTAVVYVAGTFELTEAKDLIATAAKHDRIYTHLQKLDGTPVGSFEHGEWRRFFPNPDSFL